MSTAKSQKLRKRSSEPVQIAVIGGGPKAVAIAAQAWALRTEDVADVRVTIFEPEHIGAYWSGKTGYTDGEQRLCTIAERDVGYPYNSFFGQDVDVTMASNFSWSQFLHTRPDGYENGYSVWVDAGRKPPLHKHFADYLQWVMLRTSSQAQIVKGRVVKLTASANQWHVTTSDSKEKISTHSTLFDATIVTGPGPAKKIFQKIETSGVTAPNKIFHGQDFWQRLKEVRKCLKNAEKDRKFSEDTIVIIGAGGTAAAILAWLVTNGARDLPIKMVASQASLFTRVDSVFENQLFSDDTQWEKLSETSRRAFFDRLNRGVVWATVMDRVASASNFKMVDGRAIQVVVSSSADVALDVMGGDDNPATLPASMIVDCSGFDAWWFLSLIEKFPSASSKEEEERRRKRWQKRMSENLQLQGVPWEQFPPLHAPMLSSALGPGFGSLMVLGAMAGRVLRPHRFEP